MNSMTLPFTHELIQPCQMMLHFFGWQQGHSNVTTYLEFTRRLVERFDRRGPEAPFMSLAKLKQSGNEKTYISEFLRLSVMAPNLSTTRRVYMFIYGLDEPIHGLVKYTKPTVGILWFSRLAY